MQLYFLVLPYSLSLFKAYTPVLLISACPRNNIADFKMQIMASTLLMRLFRYLSDSSDKYASICFWAHTTFIQVLMEVVESNSNIRACATLMNELIRGLKV